MNKLSEISITYHIFDVGRWEDRPDTLALEAQTPSGCLVKEAIACDVEILGGEEVVRNTLHRLLREALLDHDLPELCDVREVAPNVYAGAEVSYDTDSIWIGYFRVDLPTEPPIDESMWVLTLRNKVRRYLAEQAREKEAP